MEDAKAVMEDWGIGVNMIGLQVEGPERDLALEMEQSLEVREGRSQRLADRERQEEELDVGHSLSLTEEALQRPQVAFRSTSSKQNMLHASVITRNSMHSWITALRSGHMTFSTSLTSSKPMVSSTSWDSGKMVRTV